MLQKIMCAGIALLLLACVSSEARADSGVGQIFCWLQCGEDNVADGSLEISKVGEPVPEGFRLGEEFGGGIIAGEDVPSSSFAGWMSQKTSYGIRKKTDRNGLVVFRNLEPGMYLIRQGEEFQDYDPIEPYLACVSEELSQIDTYPVLVPRSYIPRTAQTPGLYLGSLGVALTMTGLFFWLGTPKKNLYKN